MWNVLVFLYYHLVKNHSKTGQNNLALEWRLCGIQLQLRRPPTHTRSSSVSSFRSTLSNLKRGQQYLGALVAVVHSNRYINRYSKA